MSNQHPSTPSTPQQFLRHTFANKTRELNGELSSSRPRPSATPPPTFSNTLDKANAHRHQLLSNHGFRQARYQRTNDIAPSKRESALKLHHFRVDLLCSLDQGIQLFI